MSLVGITLVSILVICLLSTMVDILGIISTLLVYVAGATVTWVVIKCVHAYLKGFLGDN